MDARHCGVIRRMHCYEVEADYDGVIERSGLRGRIGCAAG